MPTSQTTEERGKFPVLAVWAFFLLGLGCRCVLFVRPHHEGDEVIYRALVQQLDRGRGYTLHGHPILKAPAIDPAIYDRPLFLHPPGGVGLFWLLHRLFGDVGFSIAELLSYAVFFWAMVLLGQAAIRPLARVGVLLLSSLAAFSPIMTHVVSRLWLDGPLLAFATLAAALFIHGLRRGRGWADVAGLCLGYAALIKVPAVLVAPGAVLLAWSMGVLPARELAIRTARFLVIGFLIQSPWELWQWKVYGHALPITGMPTTVAIARSDYAFYVNVVLTPWFYVQQLPIVMWTVIPSFVLYAIQWNDKPLRREGAALIGWIAIVVVAFMGLSAHGYAKYLRYVILVTPATILLFTMATSRLVEWLGSTASSRAGRLAAGGLVAFALLGLVLEIVQGIWTPLIDNFDLIVPLSGNMLEHVRELWMS